MAKKFPKKKFTFIDLFAGIGGFHIAFHRLGAKCVFASEWDEAARKTYRTNFERIEPELFRNNDRYFAGDITRVKKGDIPDFDILTGGFPCQAFSHAGYKRGFEDSRGALFFDIAKIIKEKKPMAYFLENVSHLRHHDEGKTFATIKRIVEKDLKYSFHWKIVKGTDFGLPQRRPRLYMVGFRDRTIPFEFPKPRKLTKTMSSIFGAKCEKEIGFTLRVGGRGSKIHDRRNWDSYMVDGKVVRLTTKEGKKMMGLPSGFKFPVSETQAMKQLGNSVAVPAIQATAEKIIESLSNYD